MNCPPKGGAEQRKQHAGQARTRRRSALSTPERLGDSTKHHQVGVHRNPIHRQTVNPVSDGSFLRTNPQPPRHRILWRTGARCSSVAPLKGNTGCSSRGCSTAFSRPLSSLGTRVGGRQLAPRPNAGAVAGPHRSVALRWHPAALHMRHARQQYDYGPTRTNAVKKAQNSAEGMSLRSEPAATQLESSSADEVDARRKRARYYKESPSASRTFSHALLAPEALTATPAPAPATMPNSRRPPQGQPRQQPPESFVQILPPSGGASDHGLMLHMVQKHGGQQLTQESVAQQRNLDRTACVACDTIRSRRCRRGNFCRRDTPLRDLVVGDTFQDHRQPGPSSELAASASGLPHSGHRSSQTRQAVARRTSPCLRNGSPSLHRLSLCHGMGRKPRRRHEWSGPHRRTAGTLGRHRLLRKSQTEEALDSGI